jgi:hypothetical protein
MAGRDVIPAVLAEFDSPDRLLRAAAWLREDGYQRLELYSPFPIDAADTTLDLPRPRLPRLALACGLAGAAGAFWIQWFANAWNYPLVVGGRPLLSVPAWVPVTFEIGVLAAALGTFFGWLVRCGLPRLWHPTFASPGFESASADGYWVAIAVDDPRYEPVRTQHALAALDPLRITAPEPGL